jgi:hypothetical protein
MTVQALKSTSTVTLKVASISESVIGGYKTVQMIVPTSSFLKTSVPNKANSREFTGKSNKSVAEMVHTLKMEPEMFRFKNNGIRLVASELIRNNDQVTIYFQGDEGIFNGGHTYRVCQKFGVSAAYVIVTVDLNLPKEQLSKISLALNMSKKLELTSQGEKVGAFDWIKKTLPELDIIFKEGDTGKIPVEDILKVANLFRIRGHKYFDANLLRSLKDKSKILRENNTDQLLEYTRFILPDMWNLYTKIISDRVITKNLPKNFLGKKGDTISSGLALIFLTGVQYMTVVNNNNIPVWKEGYNVDTALKVCQKVSKEINKVLTRAPFKDMKATAVKADTNFHAKVKAVFADELM